MDGLTLADVKVFTRHRVQYEELWSRALTEDLPVLVFRFRTPTVFREHRRLLPFPLPSLVFHTLAKKWQRWSPIDLEGVQDWVAASVDLSSYRLHTRRLMGHRRLYPGFVGEAHFSLRRLDPVQRPAIYALALYAEWAGVGAMTTVGFGQAALLSPLGKESAFR
ncbi:MAG: CRISPR system precrRNA processing endoribonuclease RAMP protein Cas6 [Firmicutes bacterium]|nr:CRISPR system precrRNA processing endoribonuclease RAMP protein Cas6 [Bacillota bacterium]